MIRSEKGEGMSKGKHTEAEMIAALKELGVRSLFRILSHQDAPDLRPVRATYVSHFLGVFTRRQLRCILRSKASVALQDGVIGAADFVEERHEHTPSQTDIVSANSPTRRNSRRIDHQKRNNTSPSIRRPPTAIQTRLKGFPTVLED
jgi:hypothetical protein